MKYLINGTDFLSEANVVNAGKESISIRDADGNEIERINTFDRIMNRFIDNVSKGKDPEVKNWLSRNFKKWVKNGAEDPENRMADEEVMQRLFYVPLKDYINSLLRHEVELVNQKKLSYDIILESFPDFVKSNPHDAIVFSGGRLFRLSKLAPKVIELVDYLSQTQRERNEIIMPLSFVVKNLQKLTPPEAFGKSNAWHRYTEEYATKISKEQGLAMVKELKADVDYKLLDKIDNMIMVKLLSSKAASAEGVIMKHCIASYGHDIESGRVTIYSARAADDGNLPVATIEMKGKKATQLKGKHNGVVNPKYHEAIQDWFIKHDFDPGYDKKNIGWKERTDKNKK